MCRYASLFFVAAIGPEDNELITLETIHLFVEVLDRYFGNVCELDLVFNFHRAYYILDEVMLHGELQEINKREILRVTTAADDLVEAAREGTDDADGTLAAAGGGGAGAVSASKQ